VFVAWPDAPPRDGSPQGRRGGLALEAVFTLEATAPGFLHLDRFLPPSPIRVMVYQDGESLGGMLGALDAADADQAPTGLLEEHHALFDRLIPKLLDAARGQAALKESVLKRTAHREAEARLLSERDRLRALSVVNPAVTDEEIAAADAHARAVMDHIAQAEMRLDAVRLILMGDFEL
jgi:ATP-dependent helicase HepA